MRMSNISKILQVISVLLLISISETYAKDHFAKNLTKDNLILKKEYAYEGKMVNNLPKQVKDEKFLSLIIQFSPKDSVSEITNVNFDIVSHKSNFFLLGDMNNYSLDITKPSKLDGQKVSMIIDGVTKFCTMDATIKFEN